ncbi:MAG: DUF6447 family protein [Gammaproteobacteria bacterium SHHR-1]|uniref:DUF6447 family protein n=1 Tax=Magnetovirga frankeli TaxID=947516 RepID=UPI001293E9E9|nr:hypothetical protein D5125_07680 [gamma proteobacterium SS-5]
MSEEPTLTLDGKEYKMADLSDAAKAQVQNIQLTDAEIQRLNTQLAIAQTARNTYLQILQTELPTA